jgi:hypothetical protein
MTLNTRFGCDAKVRNVLASAAEGGDNVRSLLLTYIPSSTLSGPPVKAKVVLVSTSELHPLPRVVVQVPLGKAAGSLLKKKLFSDIVAVPVEPVSRVLTTSAEAVETKSRLAVRTATRVQRGREIRESMGKPPDKATAVMCNREAKTTTKPIPVIHKQLGMGARPSRFKS